MSIAARVALAIVIVAVDLVTFFVPLCALVVAWVLLTRPRWVLQAIVRLYDGVDFSIGQPPTTGPGPGDTGPSVGAASPRPRDTSVN